MANLFESPSWESGIYQLETTDRALAGADGILNVPFKQLANRTLALRKRLQQLRFNVLDFGAKPEVGFDNTTAFTQAVLAAFSEGGGTVYVPPGRYELTGSFELKHAVYLEGAGAGRSQLVLQDAGASEAHIKAEGSLSLSAVELLEAASPGQRHLRVSGDVTTLLEAPCLLAGAESGSFGGAAALPGEFIEPIRFRADFQAASTIVTGLSHGNVLRVGDVLSVPGVLPVGTTVTNLNSSEVTLSSPALLTATQEAFVVLGLLPLAQPLRAQYAPTLAKLYALTPIEVGLQGLSLLSLNEKVAFFLLLGQDCFLEDLSLEGPGAAKLRFGLCNELSVQQVRAKNSEPGIVEAAVVTLQGCQNVLLEKLKLDTQLSAISLLPWSGGAALLNRNVHVLDSQLFSKSHRPLLEAGANTDGLVLRNLTCHGTLKLGGRHLLVEDCKLFQAQPEAPIVVFDALRSGSVTFEKNVLEGHNAAGGANQYLVSCPLTGLAGLGGPLQVDFIRNTFRYEGFLGTGLFFQSAGSGRAVSFQLLENRFQAEVSSGPGRQRVGIRLLGQADGGFAQVKLERNVFQGLNVVLDRLQASLVSVLSNEFSDTPNDALSLLPSLSYHPAQLEQAVYVQHNRLVRADRTGFSLTGDASGAQTRFWVENNQLLEANQRAAATGSLSSSLLVSTAQSLFCSGNRLGTSISPATQAYGFAVQNVQALFEFENQLLGNLTNFTSGVAERIGRMTHNGQLKEAYRTTAPTTGTWMAGDRVWNSAPNNRKNLGWVCIGSGSPGTWVSLGADQNAVQVKLHGPFVMTEGQVLLTLPEPYQTNRRLLQVFRSGLALSQGTNPEGTDFDWVVENSTTIRFRKPCLQDEVVEVIEFQIGEDDAAAYAPPTISQTQEIPTGDVDSTDGFDGNGVFHVSHEILLEPIPVVKISGIAELRYGIDYSVDGSTITINPGAKPIAPEWLVVTYYHTST